MTTDILNSRMPNIELSYGTLLHMKVQADFYQLIPQGVKCLIWYTYWKGDNVCYILTLNNTSDSIKSVEKTIACFNDDLCYGNGTMVSGHMFKHKGINIVSVVDIHYYKGFDLNNENYFKKFGIIADFFSKDTRQDIYSDKQLLVAFPVTSCSYNEAISLAKTSVYPIHSIALLNNNDTKQLGYYKYIDRSVNDAVFLIKPRLRFDMYDLYVENNSEPIGVASITDYKTSVMMNNIFRKIKENSNLDFLEESDDDEEFENVNVDKHVDLNKSEVMRCTYIPKFKKWKPISLCKKDTRLTSKQDMIMLEKKYGKN